MLLDGSTNSGSTTEGRCGPVSRLAGERNDWIQKVVRHPPRKEDVIVALLKMLRQPTTQLYKKTRDLDPMALSHRRKLMAWSRQSGDDSKTVVDQINGRAKQPKRHSML